MSNQQRQARLGSATSMNVLRSLLALLAVAVAVILVVLAWDGIGAATDETHWRIFLVGWVGAVAVMAAVIFLPHSALPLAVQHVVIGIVVGLAIGTTDWTDLSMDGWWQLWWTVPLLLSYLGFLVTRWRRPRTQQQPE